jgi:hypothetical protein
MNSTNYTAVTEIGLILSPQFVGIEELCFLLPRKCMIIGAVQIRVLSRLLCDVVTAANNMDLPKQDLFLLKMSDRDAVRIRQNTNTATGCFTILNDLACTRVARISLHRKSPYNESIRPIDVFDCQIFDGLS